MAAGDKIYIADKETLDLVKNAVNAVNANTADTRTKVGTTADTGGTASTGTIFGKLNAIISSIATHVANWTAARAANLDAQVSSRESEANAAVRHEATAQALSNMTADIASINAGVNVSARRLSAKKVVASVPRGTTATVLNVTGAGVFHGGYIGCNSASSTCVITLDGVDYAVVNSNSGVFGRVLNSPNMFDTVTGAHTAVPAEFKESLSISVRAANDVDVPFYGDYSMYE